MPVKTTWTLLLYLTSAAEGCIGGETVFYPHDRKSTAEEIAVSLETGMLLLHKHGDDCLLVSRRIYLLACLLACRSIVLNQDKIITARRERSSRRRKVGVKNRSVCSAMTVRARLFWSTGIKLVGICPSGRGSVIIMHAMTG